MSWCRSRRDQSPEASAARRQRLTRQASLRSAGPGDSRSSSSCRFGRGCACSPPVRDVLGRHLSAIPSRMRLRGVASGRPVRSVAIALNAFPASPREQLACGGGGDVEPGFSVAAGSAPVRSCRHLLGRRRGRPARRRPRPSRHHARARGWPPPHQLPVRDVARALDAGEVFKTYAFRGATHLLTPEEGGIYLPSVRPAANGSCPAGRRPTD